MLRISKLTDYGVVVLTHLAECPEPHPVSVLAEETRIPAPTVSKVLKRLGRSGVVTSTRGVRGGYMLARPADTITVHEIVSALEGPIAVTECSDDHAGTSCEYEDGCGVRANWQQINSAVQQALSAVTLADMARPQGLRLVHLARSRDEAKQTRRSGAGS